VALAAAAGCRAVALTDHDRLDGIQEARAEADRSGLELVPGCELSCVWGPGTFHLLVYFLEPGSGHLQDHLSTLQAQRDDRNRRLVAQLQELGLPITLEEVQAEAGGAGVGRPHVAAVLVRKGVVGSISEAFDRWLAKGQPGYVAKATLDPAKAIDLALASRGVAVLAHPHSLGLEPGELGSTMRELSERGLAGMECHYGGYQPEERAGLTALAARLGLVATGGSDYHGRYKPDLSVGTGRGDLDVPDAVLDSLRDRVAA
jgi:predicted metal-dependent phosphoesterase TrpH